MTTTAVRDAEASRTPRLTRLTRLRSGVALLGPAFVAAIAYVDPGNVATNFAAGSEHGYLLLWVIVAANLMAALVQFLSAKLGIVTGMSLPEALRDRLPGPVRIGFWIQAELVAMATDLAEVLGGAIALQILFGLPLLLGGVATGAMSMLLLTVHSRYGQRPFERAVTALLLVVAGGFVAGLFVSAPSPSGIAGGLLPRLAGSGSVLLAVGILGATMMPHAVYLHSALARDRFAGSRPGVGPIAAGVGSFGVGDSARAGGSFEAGEVAEAEHAAQQGLLRAVRWDVGTAMLLAGTVNVAMLVLAAASLHGHQLGDSLSQVPAALRLSLGHTVALLFAIGLLASGLAATAVGCYAGAVVMDGLLNRRIPVSARRLATLVPALVVLAIGVDPTRALVLSQVVLSFGIPFAVVPLVVLTSRRAVMGRAVNARATTIAAGSVTVLVVSLNLLLIGLILSGAG
ncbi:MAG: Nramp family divalent metal transporter [Actinomycetota bacterium]|nr:Nramp family divalent metal transporter [Actinomycetota bacterium]